MCQHAVAVRNEDVQAFTDINRPNKQKRVYWQPVKTIKVDLDFLTSFFCEIISLMLKIKEKLKAKKTTRLLLFFGRVGSPKKHIIFLGLAMEKKACVQCVQYLPFTAHRRALCIVSTFRGFFFILEYQFEVFTGGNSEQLQY